MPMKGLLAVVLALCTLQAGAAVVSAETMARPEGARHYWLAAPQQAAAGKRPLVIVLHGHAGSGAKLLGKDGADLPMRAWLDIADREQLLVIAPDGAKGSDNMSGWNDCRSDATTNPHIDKAVAGHDADPARIYVMGTSNGGGMVYRLAMEMAPRLAAIAAIAAPWPANSLCPMPRQALPALIVHGTADKLVPYRGGEIGNLLLRGRGTAIGVDDTVALWRKLAKLPAGSTDTTFPHRDDSGATIARRVVWGDDARGMQIELIRIEGGGHTEPSIRHRLRWAYTFLLGAQNGDLELAEEAWRFFRDKRVSNVKN
jgi:polyhydroxybutyrate depolymerase